MEGLWDLLHATALPHDFVEQPHILPWFLFTVEACFGGELRNSAGIQKIPVQQMLQRLVSLIHLRFGRPAGLPRAFGKRMETERTANKTVLCSLEALRNSSLCTRNTYFLGWTHLLNRKVAFLGGLLQSENGSCPHQGEEFCVLKPHCSA